MVHKQEKKGNQEIENWLRYMLSKNADFEIQSIDIDGKHIEMLIISKAAGVPVTFEKVDYIRIGSYTKKIIEFPSLQTQLWDKLRHEQFEEIFTMVDLRINDVVKFLKCDTYFDILNLPIPTSMDGYKHYFGRKAIRIVQYEGNNRLTILKEDTTNEGYAISFENATKLVNNLLPAKEDINSVRRKSINLFPLPAIREAIANSLIHQDFFLTGAGPVVEIFENRVEVTNPGTPLVDIMRIIDNPPKSRNEKLASLMRRLNMCEELGRGWDRMVISCELQQLPAPRIQIYQESTKVSLFSHLDFTNIPVEDKLWSTYLHACIKFTEGESLTNTSLRERFGVAETSAGSISRLIKEAVNKKLIRPVDPTTAPRYMKYIPVWA